MGEGVRGLHRPFQVICVLAAVLLTAAISLKFGPAERAGPRPIPDKPFLRPLGERLNANTIIAGNLGITPLARADAPSDGAAATNATASSPVTGGSGRASASSSQMPASIVRGG